MLLHCSCSPAEKTDICSGCKARMYPSTFSWCSASFAEVFANALEIWTLWKPFTMETKLTACCLEHTLCSPQLSSVFFSCTAHCHPPAKISSIPKASLSKTPYIQWSHVLIWTKPLLWLCLHRARVTQSIISPSCDACEQSVPSAPSALQDPVSQHLSDVAACPSAEWAEIQIAHYSELSDSGLLNAQWKAAFGYNF